MKKEKFDEKVEIEFEKKAEELRQIAIKKGKGLKPGWEGKLRKKIQEEMMRKQDRNKFIAGLAATGVTVGAMALASGAQTEEPVAQERKSRIQTEAAETETERKSYDSIEEMLKEYNDKNPDIEITMDNVGIVKRNTTQYIFKEDGKYKENYKDTNGNEWIDEIRTRDIYTLLDKKNQKIISSIGDVNYELTYIEAQEIRDPNNIPYYGDESEMVLIEQYELEEFKEECESFLQKRLKEIKEAKKQEEER